MKQLRTSIFVAALAAAAFTVAFNERAVADEHDKFTKITVNEPVRLPGIVLEPGNYTLRLLEDASNRHLVKVSDENGKGLIVILAMNNYRMEPKDKTVLTYWEAPAGQPRPVRAWFFPGDNYGQEFAYPKSEADLIASYQHQNVASVPDNTKESDLTTTQVQQADTTPYDSGPALTQTQTQANVAAAPAPERENQVIAQATPPPAPPITDNTPAASAATPAAAPDTLPQTGTDLPTIGLIGALSFAAFVMTLGRKRTRVQ
jgi:LPXTG-motif cell wall-anchored protein